MFVYRVALDMEQNHAVVLLADESEQRLLPIWIGIFEAKAIATELHGEPPERPMTHDLLGAVIREVGYRMDRITITALRENTFYALITLVRNGEVLEIDSRPSDSIALALRCDAKIFVAEEVLAQTEIRPGQPGPEDDDIDRFERLMAQVDLMTSELPEPGSYHVGGAEPPASPEEPQQQEESGEDEAG